MSRREELHRATFWSRWSAERRLEYLAWAASVVDRLPQISPPLRERFDEVYRQGIGIVNGGGA